MKIKRYNRGQTSVDMLESGRRALRSSSEVAQAEYASYGALAGAAESIGNDFNRLQERDRQLQAQEDAHLGRKMNQSIQVITSEVMNDPDLGEGQRLPVYEEKLKELRQGLEGFHSEKKRQQHEELYSLLEQAGRNDVIGKVNQQREERLIAEHYGAHSLAIENNDWGYAKETADIMLEQKWITQDQHRSMVARDERAKLVNDARDIVADGMAVYQESGRDAWDRWQSEQLLRDDLEPDLKRELDSQLVHAEGVFNKAEQREVEMFEGQVIQDVSATLRDIEQGTWDMATDLDQVYESYADKLGHVKAARYVEQIRNALTKQIDVDSKYMDYQQNIFEGGRPLNEESDRRSLQMEDDHLVQGWQAEGLSEDEIYQRQINLYQTRGILPQKYHDNIKAAKGNATELARYAKFITDVSADPTRQVKGIDPVSRAQAMQAYRMAATDDPNAIREVLDMNLKASEDATTYGTYRNQVLTDNLATKEEGVSFAIRLAQDGFEELRTGSDYYDRAILGTGVDDFEREDHLRAYLDYIRTGYMNFNGDETSAINYANAMFQRSHPVNNINGQLQVQYGGLEGDVRQLALDYYASNKDTKFLYTDDGISFKSATLGEIQGMGKSAAVPRGKPGAFISRPDTGGRVELVPKRRDQSGVVYEMERNGMPLVVANPKNQKQLEQMVADGEITPEESRLLSRSVQQVKWGPEDIKAAELAGKDRRELEKLDEDIRQKQKDLEKGHKRISEIEGFVIPSKAHERELARLKALQEQGPSSLKKLQKQRDEKAASMGE